MIIRSLAATLLISVSSTLYADGPPLRCIGSGDNTLAVVVDARVGVVHTGQALAADAEAALEGIEGAIHAAGGDPKQVIKLNVVAATQEDADAIRAAIGKRYDAANRPSVAFVVGALAQADATVGIDAVAVSTAAAATGAVVYISGQAEKGATSAEAAAGTIAGLVETLAFVGADKRNVLQARCFLTPMTAAADVVAEFDKVFGKGALPIVFVEWKSDLPIEIELIATAPAASNDAPDVEYLTPPGLNPSPVFARIVRINRGSRIYTAGLYALEPGTGEAQVLSVFEQLRDIVHSASGDLRHLVKATYYVSDADASKQLNVLRPKFYDPQRPPAASKAMVPGTGMDERTISIDMIGIVPTTVAPPASP
jgi:enamine deaminase RidA (YjgF/YER057c/UK114 family)